VRPAAVLHEAASPTRTGKPKRPPLVPAQHGAWGFLGLPLVLGTAAAGWSPWLPLLGISWVAAYPASWALTGILTARRPERFHHAALLWVPVCTLAGTPVLVAHPWLVWVAMVYLALFGVNVQQARTHRERSLTNDLVLIAECALLVPVLAGIGAGAHGLLLPLRRMSAGPVLTAALACALTLIGSTLHVKSLIRERRNPAFSTAARGFAVAAPVLMAAGCAVAGASVWMAAPFLWLAARALWLHDPSRRPAQIGMLELGGFLAVAATALLVL